MKEINDVIVYHVGARDNYAIAKFFAKRKKLKCLITDYWLIFDCILFPKIIKNKLNRRYDAKLLNFKIYSYTVIRILFSEIAKKLIKSKFSRWKNHDKQFTKFVIKKINKSKPDLIWGYTNANLEVLEYFKQATSTIKIHNQIDPGIEYYNIQQQLWEANKEYEVEPEKLPKFFEERLRKEWELSDIIIVNSEFSKKCLVKNNVPDSKIEILPLIYESKKHIKKKEFNSKLNIAFVGNVNLIKGFKLFIDVAKDLNGIFNFVAIGNIFIKKEIVDYTKSFIEYVGHVSKFDLEERYQKIDILIFPTFCDGFGMVQLEAMSFGIPVIATKHCGSVVKDGINGYVISSKDQITNKLLILNENRDLLKILSKNAIETINEYSYDKFEVKLDSIIKNYKWNF